MFRFLVQRTLRAVITLVAISIVTFVLFFMVPAKPAELMCGKNCAPEQIQQVQEKLGLSDSKVVQYEKFISGLFVGRWYGKGEFRQFCPAPCLGFSYRSNELVRTTIARTLPVTISIVSGAAVVWLVFGISLGMISALRRGTLFDKLAIGVSLVGASLQVFFLGLVLLIIFVYKGHIMSYPQYTSLWSNPLLWLKAMILPWLTIGLLSAAIYARLSRAQMLETLSEDFVRTARAKGVPKRQVYLRHAFRAAITPLVTVAGLDIGGALGGTVITETVYSMNGLGKTTVDAVNNLNFPVVMATVLLAAAFIVIANAFVDALYAVIDPRVRLA